MQEVNVIAEGTEVAEEVGVELVEQPENQDESQKPKTGVEFIHAKKPLLNKLVDQAVSNYSPEAKVQRWEDFQDIHQQHSIAIVEVAESIAKIVQIPDLNEWIADKAEFKVLVEGINKDLNSYTDDLCRIRDLTQGRTGVIPKEGADWVDYLTIFDEYVDFGQRFQSIVMPVVTIITDHVAVAINRASRAKKEAEAAAAAKVDQIEEGAKNE